MRNSVHLLKESFLEPTLLSFQDMMLTKGAHYFHATSLEVAREWFYSFLRLSFPYKHAGCITAHGLTLDGRVEDIYQTIIANGYCDNEKRSSEQCCKGVGKTHTLDTFFYDQCHYDFLWIEKNIYDNNCLIESFEGAINAHCLENSIPIVIVYYRE